MIHVYICVFNFDQYISHMSRDEWQHPCRSKQDNSFQSKCINRFWRLQSTERLMWRLNWNQIKTQVKSEIVKKSIFIGTRQKWRKQKWRNFDISEVVSHFALHGLHHGLHSCVIGSYAHNDRVKMRIHVEWQKYPKFLSPKFSAFLSFDNFVGAQFYGHSKISQKIKKLYREKSRSPAS